MNPAERQWVATLLAEMAERRGAAAEAESHYRAALRIGLHDPYLLAAYGDFLLDRGRSEEVIKLLRHERKADALLLLSNVPGLLRNFPDESSLIARVPKGDIESAAEYAQGRMKKKVLGAQEALAGGVKRIILGDSRGQTPVRAALQGKGTVFE